MRKEEPEAKLFLNSVNERKATYNNEGIIDIGQHTLFNAIMSKFF